MGISGDIWTPPRPGSYVYDPGFSLLTNFDEFGILMVETTDPNGNDIDDTTHIAQINPFRFALSPGN